MALFGFKKKQETGPPAGGKKQEASKPVEVKKAKPVKKETAVTVPAAKTAVTIPGNTSSDLAGVIIRPRITEKSGMLSQNNVYTFEVGKDANKFSVGRAVIALYKVTPVKVAMINSPAKRVFVRGRSGRVPGIRKAVVTVKKGDKIDFV